MSNEDFVRLLKSVREHGEPAERVYLHLETYAWLAEIERKRRHWYWRVWFRLRWLPWDVWDWLQAHVWERDVD